MLSLKMAIKNIEKKILPEDNNDRINYVTSNNKTGSALATTNCSIHKGSEFM